MPVNAPREYFKAEEKFHNARTKEEKVVALEEMVRLMPKHHGSEAALAQLKSRLAKLRKESSGKKGGSKALAITKEGDAQVCMLGFTNSGKSSLLAKLTDAKPAIASHPYTTTKPEIGMIDYRGIKIQFIETPATFDHKYLSIARTADLVVLVVRHEKEEEDLKSLLQENFIRTKFVVVNSFVETPSHIKEKIWHALGLMIIYSKKTKTPMSLPIGATVKDFAKKIHKDFIKDFRFARINRVGRIIQAGLDYALQDGDSVEIHTK